MKKNMAQPFGQVDLPYGTDVWHAFSVYIPEDFNEIPYNNLIYQFHAWPDSLEYCDDWRSPPLAIRFRHDNWYIKLGYSSQECTKGNEEIDFAYVKEEQPFVKETV